MAARDAGAARIGAAFPPPEHLKLDPALNPFEEVEFDGHKLDLRLTLKVQDPYGMDTYLEVSRIWILVVIEVVSRAILGYAVAFWKRVQQRRCCDSSSSFVVTPCFTENIHPWSQDP